jgi:glycosyltransferase involved in cell wall biosynthesis
MQTEKTHKISVILPAFNEALTIGNVISDVIGSLDQIGLPYEIIVVDDGSVDLTGEMAEAVGATVVRLPDHCGLGYALRRGFSEAVGDLIVTMDADGVHDAREIKKLIAPLLNGADVVAGSRFLDEHGRSYSSLRDRIGNFLFNFLFTVLTDTRISDPATSYRAYKADVVRNLQLQSYGSEIEAEISMKTLKKRDLNYLEVPIKIQPKRYYVSRTRVFEEGLRLLKRILISGYFSRR